MNNNLFIVTSHLHVFLVDILVKYLDLKNVTIFTKKEFKHFFHDYNVYVYYFPGLNENRILKLPKLLYNYFSVDKKHYDSVYIPNDSNPFNQALLKNIDYYDLIYYEEGATAFYKIQEQMNNKNQSRSMFLKSILGLEQTKTVLTSKKIKKAYVFLEEILKKISPDIEFINLSNIVKEKYQFSKMNIDQEFLNPDYLIATQPLTEDYYCKNFEEVEAIEEFIKNNLNKRIVLKVHPRERLNKYSNIIRDYGNVLLLPEKYNVYPYQILHFSLLPTNIVSFFSSILLTVESTNPLFKRISLVSLLKNNNEMKEIMKEYKKYVDDLIFYHFSEYKQNEGLE